MKKVSIILIAWMMIFFCIDVRALVDVTTGVNGGNGWVNVTPDLNSFDFLNDQQTGSGSVSQDLIGGKVDFGTGLKDYGVFYVQFDDNGTVTTVDDELAFRFRVNDADGVGNDTFQFYVFVAFDYDLNGSIDLFTGMYNPDNNGSKSISIYSSDPTKSNLSPSTTGFGDKLFETTPVKNSNWSLMVTDDGSLFAGDPDYFVTFKLKLSDINVALASANPEWVMTTSSPLRMMIGTASQANSYNQDMGGVQGFDTKSDVPWVDLGVFAPIVNPTGEPVNQAPTAQDSQLSVGHNSFVKFKPTASDLDNDALTYQFGTLSQPTCGALTGPDSDGYYTYTDNGTCLTTSNTITFTANDGTDTSNLATITFKPINEAPVAYDNDYDVAHNGSVKFKPSASDVENDGLTYQLGALSNPTCGGVSGPDSDGYYTYTDNGACLTGSNTLTFTAKDASNTSNTATIAFNVLNEAPVVQDADYDVAHNGSVKFKPIASDPENDPITVLLGTLGDPTCGTLSGPDADGDYTYNDNGTCLTGSNAVTFTARDGDSVSKVGTITFNPINEGPISQDDSYNLPRNGSVKFKLTGSDPENDALAFLLGTLKNDTCGTLTGPDSDDYYTYTDNGTCVGSNSVDFTVSDLDHTSKVYTVTFNPLEVVAYDQTLYLVANGTVKIKLAATDSNNHILTYHVTQPACGTLTGPDENGDYTYVSTNAQCSTDSFTFTASYVDDGITFTSNTATITLNIASPIPNTGESQGWGLMMLMMGLGLLLISKRRANN